MLNDSAVHVQLAAETNSSCRSHLREGVTLLSASPHPNVPVQCHPAARHPHSLPPPRDHRHFQPQPISRVCRFRFAPDPALPLLRHARPSRGSCHLQTFRLHDLAVSRPLLASHPSTRGLRLSVLRLEVHLVRREKARRTASFGGQLWKLGESEMQLRQLHGRCFPRTRWEQKPHARQRKLTAHGVHRRCLEAAIEGGPRRKTTSSAKRR